MSERTKEELKRDKATKILAMIKRSQEMLGDLADDVRYWSGNDEIPAEEAIEHQMHQNETCANLQFLIDYLQNRQRRS